MNSCKCGEKSDFLCSLSNEIICAECCSDRSSKKLDCPDDCTMNLFNSVDAITFQKTALNTFFKMRDILLRLDDSYNLGFARDLRNINIDYEFADAEFAALLYKHFFINRKINGNTMYEFLRQHEFRSFSKDEVVILNAKKNAKPTIIEFIKKINTDYFEAIDLLGDTTQKIKMCDSKIAQSNIQKPANILVWLEQYPKFSAPGHFAMQLPDYIVEDLIAELNALAISYGFASDENSVKLYLTEHLLQTTEMIKDIKNEYIDEILSPLDDEGGYYVEFPFDPETYWDIKEIFETKEDFIEHEIIEMCDDENVICFEWIPAGNSKEVEAKLTLFLADSKNFSQNALKAFGFILLYNDKIVVSSHSRLLIQFAEIKLKEYFHDILK
jgi:hypothetical protein